MRELELLIKSSTYHNTKLQNEIYGIIKEYLDNNKEATQDEIAWRLGITKEYFSQIYNEGVDLKLSNFYRIAMAVNKIPHIEFLSIEEYLKREREDRGINND